MNAHRTSWRGVDGGTVRVCHAPGCGIKARTVKEQQQHADVHEPGLLRAARRAHTQEDQ